MNLLLIGYRGSGKTTVGKIVAQRLRLRFVDTDALVVDHFGMSIADIWKTRGEPAFRKTEREVIAELLRNDKQVIALGGGAVMQPDARRAIESASDAVCVYLRATPEVLHRRIHADAATRKDRPPLTPLGGTFDEIRNVLAQRESTYQALADHILGVDDLSPEDAAQRIVEAVKPR